MKVSAMLWVSCSSIWVWNYRYYEYVLCLQYFQNSFICNSWLILHETFEYVFERKFFRFSTLYFLHNIHCDKPTYYLWHRTNERENMICAQLPNVSLFKFWVLFEWFFFAGKLSLMKEMSKHFIMAVVLTFASVARCLFTW